MRLLSERSCAKMATGSDLLRDVFEADEKVVSSSDVSGSPAAGHVNTTVGEQCSENHDSAGDTHSNVPSSKMGLSQQELAKAGTRAPQVVLNSAANHGSSMDGTTGTRTTSPVGPSVTAAHSQPKAAASGVAAVVTEVGTPGSTGGVQTLNGSSAVVNCHVPDSSSQQVTLVNNVPVTASKAVPAAPTTIIRTSSPVISSQSSVKPVPTVTLVRAPMQTPTNALQSGGNPGTAVSTPPVVTAAVATNKPDSVKTVVQTGAHIVTSTSVVSGTSAATRSPTVLQTLRATLPSTPAAGVRAIAPQVLAPRLTQPQQNAPNIQNIQLPPGMVLIRSESGQLLMIHQQALAQMQSQSQSAMAPRPAAPTNAPPVQLSSLQAPGASLLARSVAPTTIIKQGSAAQTTVTPTITKLQRPPVLQNTIMLGGNATTPSPQLGTSTVTTVQPASAATTVAQRVVTAVKPGTSVAPTPVSAETLENVKKCRNFLSTLIKLASSGKQSTETTASVKDLVKSLLVGKIEPEDFTSRLYKELNSSPQPYLVPFLKRSLPALRQMTPDPDTFIQQSLLPQPSSAAASAALTAVMMRPPPSTAATVATSTTTTKATVISLTQTPHSKPALQQGTILRPQVTQSPMVTLRGQPQNRIIVGQPQVVKQLQSAVKQTLVPGARGVQVVSQTSLSAAQVKLKEAGGGGAFRDDDDINDVASMAGVNLSEESARIMATNSDLVGAVTRSCKDEAFLSVSSLTLRALEIGKKFGVGELGPDVINFISHATQQRLQNLLEKVTHVAQQKNVNFKDERHEQVSDVRTQLRFFEQLDQMEKQRKDDQEREILLKAAKSRSRQEDPEQLRLKQKAKEMQQQELAQIRQREANLTALAAIGPRKKRKMNSPIRGASAEGSGSGPCQPTGSSGAGPRQFMRQRITRVNLRDLLLCLENERGTSHSHLLYKGFLK